MSGLIQVSQTVFSLELLDERRESLLKKKSCFVGTKRNKTHLENLCFTTDRKALHQRKLFGRATELIGVGKTKM